MVGSHQNYGIRLVTNDFNLIAEVHICNVRFEALHGGSTVGVRIAGAPCNNLLGVVEPVASFLLEKLGRQIITCPKDDSDSYFY